MQESPREKTILDKISTGEKIAIGKYIFYPIPEDSKLMLQ